MFGLPHNFRGKDTTPYRPRGILEGCSVPSSTGAHLFLPWFLLKAHRYFVTFTHLTVVSVGSENNQHTFQASLGRWNVTILARSSSQTNQVWIDLDKSRKPVQRYDQRKSTVKMRTECRLWYRAGLKPHTPSVLKDGSTGVLKLTGCLTVTVKEW